MLRSLNGGRTGVHKVLYIFAEIALQRTARFLPRTRWWIHDFDPKQSWLGNENSF